MWYPAAFTRNDIGVMLTRLQPVAQSAEGLGDDGPGPVRNDSVSPDILASQPGGPGGDPAPGETAHGPGFSRPSPLRPPPWVHVVCAAGIEAAQPAATPSPTSRPPYAGSWPYVMVSRRPGATATVDRTFTITNIPTDLVWQSLHRRGFTRGATRQWTESDGTEVSIVLFEFQTAGQTAAFVANLHNELLLWPGCGGWAATRGRPTAGSRVCRHRPHDRPSARATLYSHEIAEYIVALEPTPRDSIVLDDLVVRASALLT